MATLSMQNSEILEKWKYVKDKNFVSLITFASHLIIAIYFTW